jgi:hypothetical protein
MTEENKQAGPKKDSVFFNARNGQYGEFFSAKLGEDQATITELQDGTIGVKVNQGERQVYQPKTNQHGAYFVVDLPIGRCFVSKGENKIGAFYKARVAPERAPPGAPGSRPERPAAYGGRPKTK